MIDLHLHLDGSLVPEKLIQMAELSGISLPVEDIQAIEKFLMAAPDCRNLGEYLEKFALPLQVLQMGETLELAVYDLVERLAAQGLCYGEIRFAPQLHTTRGLTQREAVQAAREGLKKGMRDTGIQAKLILCCMRGNDNQAENKETIQVAGDFAGDGVCAVDLAGNETAYPTEQFGDLFREAARIGIPATIHAGEAAGADSIRKALIFGAARIGHGIAAVKDPVLMEELREKEIVLELCYSSNLQTKAVECPADYPLVEFLSRGICATINTDNMTVSNTTLRHEYTQLQQQFALDESTLKRLALNAAEGAFVSKDEKKALREQVEQGFSGWLNSEKELLERDIVNAPERRLVWEKS